MWHRAVCVLVVTGSVIAGGFPHQTQSLMADQSTPGLLDRLSIAAHVYSADGRITSQFHPLGALARPVVGQLGTIDSLCVFQSATSVPPANGWRFTATPLAQINNDVVVRVEWTRIRHRGEEVTGPVGNIELTLSAGERVPLDAIGATPVGNCRAVSMVLQVEVEGRRR